MRVVDRIIRVDRRGTDMVVCLDDVVVVVYICYAGVAGYFGCVGYEAGGGWRDAGVEDVVCQARCESEMMRCGP